MNLNIIAITLGVVIVWLILISILLFGYVSKFRDLTKNSKKGDLIKILDTILKTEKKNSQSISDLFKEVKRIDTEKLDSIQKVGYIRFNPFNELGGDHSFVLALLDGKDNGVLITGLHTRERTRMYVKDVKKGKTQVELSKEEAKALSEAFKK